MPNTGLNTRFILAEDAAIKTKFSGLQVDYPQLRDVDIWFRWPNKEVRDVVYPYITVDLADVVKADHREHAGTGHRLGYMPYGYEPVEDLESDQAAAHVLGIAPEWPTPYDLIYTVTTFARDPRHDRQLMARLLGDRDLLPWRMAYLEIPEDGTIRRMDLLDITDFTSRNANQDTEFRRAFTVRVESELFVGSVKDVMAAHELFIVLTETASGLSEEFETGTTLTFE